MGALLGDIECGAMNGRIGFNARLFGGVVVYIASTLVWLRCGKHILVISRAPLLFSERNGYKKYKKLWFGWRIMDVKP